MKLLLFTLGLLVSAVRSQCPDPPEGVAGTCVFTDENCLQDSECVNDQICCPHLCGKICKDKKISKPVRVIPVCGPVCAVFCQFGNVLDDHGCPTCTCKKSPCDNEAPLTLDGNGNSINCGRGTLGICPKNSVCEIHPADRYAVCCPKVCGPVCAIFCEFGNVPDESGCPTCACKKSPCDNEAPLTLDGRGNSIKCGLTPSSCPPTSVCKIDLAGNFALCCPKVCVEPVCENFCIFGNVVDSVGCKTCTCKKTPCDNEAPIAVDNRGEEVGCGRGTTGICPDNSECKTDPADRFAVCCTKGPTFPSPADKPGVCPSNAAISCLAGSIVDTCSVDDNCPGSQKCCNLCGKTCSPPEGSGPIGPIPVGKPGSCPVPPSAFLVRCAFNDLCKDDNECPGTKKCCNHPCGKRCRDTVKSKSGVCPPQVGPASIVDCERRGDKCYEDSTCPGSQKCCQSTCGNTCTNSRLTSTDNEGTCPRLDPDVQARIFCASLTTECELDSECNSDEKCCQDYCGIKCVKSVKSIKKKPGVCPKLTPPLPQCFRFQNDCDDDSSCPGSQKCCNVLCGIGCANPIGDLVDEPVRPSTKPGTCRRFRYRCRRRQRNLCSTDGDCPGSRKCCKLPCGKRCRIPRRSSRPKRACPVVNTHYFYRLFCSLPRDPPCRVNGDCNSGEICCPGTCFNRCLRDPTKPACDPNPCGNAAIKCQFGQEKDENGCLLCKCRNCPEGVQEVQCFEDPCQVETCSNPAGVRCVSNFCGGCNADFFDVNNNKVNCQLFVKG